jgi:hypothetical protein
MKMNVTKKTSAEVSQPSTVTALVGKQCFVECCLQGQRTQALWDTGSTVCIIDELWKDENLPGVRLKNVADIIDSPNSLQIL